LRILFKLAADKRGLRRLNQEIKNPRASAFIRGEKIMSEKFATAEGTKQYTERFPNAASGHFRAAQGLTLSSIGIGTYLGRWDAATDENYTNAITKFVESGGNVIDTAANYRFQRSERNIGKALQNLTGKDFGREEVFISTKGGYLPFDNEPPSDVRGYFEKEFVEKGIATFDDLVGGSHCMTPDYLQSQIDQSLRNMSLETLDLFYIHNPESQLGVVDKYTLRRGLRRHLNVWKKTVLREKSAFTERQRGTVSAFRPTIKAIIRWKEWFR